MLALPIIVLVAPNTVFYSLFHLVHHGICVCMRHYDGLCTCALLCVFLHKGIVLGNLSLLVVEVGIGLVISLALRVAVSVLVALSQTKPSAADV